MLTAKVFVSCKTEEQERKVTFVMDLCGQNVLLALKIVAMCKLINTTLVLCIP